MKLCLFYWFILSILMEAKMVVKSVSPDVAKHVFSKVFIDFCEMLHGGTFQNKISCLYFECSCCGHFTVSLPGLHFTFIYRSAAW